MKNKNFILALIGCAAIGIASFVVARDNTGDGSGVVRERSSGRWQLARSATTTTSATSVTNVILSKAGMVTKIMLIPASGTTVFEVHNAATTATCTAANEVFRISTNVVSTLNTPIIYDVSPNWDCTTGITTVIQPGSTALVERAFISYDSNN